MINILQTLILMVFVFVGPLPTSAAAQADTKGAVEITADRLEADQGARTLLFSGNAVAHQADMTIRADSLLIIYTAQGQDIDQLVATGNVRIDQGRRIASGERAVFDRAEDRIVLTGAPRVSEGENFVQGEEITLLLKEDRSIVTGGSGGRVNAVFTPKAEERP